VLLHHLTGQEDIIVGSPSAGQLLAEKPNLVGYCVNLLPLRSRVTSVMSFAQYLKALKQIVLQAHEQQAYPYTRLLKKLNLPRRSGRSPLVEAVFNLDYGQTTAKFFDLQAEIIANHSGSSKFDVTFDVTDHRTHFTLDCEYNTGLFDASRARTWMRQCEAILGLVATTPEMKISQIRAYLRELDKEQDACGGGRVHARPGADFQIGRRASVQTA
jgi:non-ribosomal peptide synthetase component F